MFVSLHMFDPVNCSLEFQYPFNNEEFQDLLHTLRISKETNLLEAFSFLLLNPISFLLLLFCSSEIMVFYSV